MEIDGAIEQEAGLYTCTAHSHVGADVKTVTVAVGGYVPDPFMQPLNMNIRSVQTHSVLVFWENSGSWALSLISWLASAENSSSPRPLRARHPAGVTAYRVKRLRASTRYLVCVHLRSAQQEVNGNCINVTTREAAAPQEAAESQDRLLMAASVVDVIAVAAACSVMHTALNSQVL